MLGADLQASQRRLESRGREVAERARQKAEKERLAAERQAARAAKREDEARHRWLVQLAAEEEERRQHAAELEANNGVLYRAELTAVPAPESVAADKGIRRAADKARPAAVVWWWLEGRQGGRQVFLTAVPARQAQPAAAAARRCPHLLPLALPQPCTISGPPCPIACPHTQILLPPSAGAALMIQDAYKNGPMYFRLTAPGGRYTHAGLLEFSAAEGFVALPLKVLGLG